MKEEDYLLLKCVSQVFSLINPASLDSLQSWVEMLSSKLSSVDLILVGTFSDKCGNSADVIASIKKRFLRIKYVMLYVCVLFCFTVFKGTLFFIL